MDVEPHVVQDGHHVRDCGIELHRKEVCSHQCDHARHGGAEGEQTEHRRFAHPPFDRDRANRTHPRCSRHGFEHVRIRPAIGDVPTQHHGDRVQEHRETEDPQSNRARARPLPHETKQEEDRGRHVDEPHARHVIVLEVPVLPTKSRLIGIRLGADLRKFAAERRNRAVHRVRITLQPTTHKRTPRVTNDRSLLGRQVFGLPLVLRKKQHRARHGLLAIRKHHGRNAVPLLRCITIAARNDLQPRQEEARVFHGDRRIDRAHDLFGSNEIAAHFAQDRNRFRLQNRCFRNQPCLFKRFHLLVERRTRLWRRGRKERVGDALARPRALDVDHVGVAIDVRTEEHVEIREERVLPVDLTRARDECHHLLRETRETLQATIALHRDRSEWLEIHALDERLASIRCIRIGSWGRSWGRTRRRVLRLCGRERGSACDQRNHRNNQAPCHAHAARENRVRIHASTFLPLRARPASTSSCRRRLITGFT